MRRLALSCSLATLIAACSSGQPDQPNKTPQPQSSLAAASARSATVGTATPANPALGSKEWYDWVDQTLGLSDDNERGPQPGSPPWNETVQRRLGQEAPPAQPGSPDWQQAVDALLRTRGLDRSH